MEGSEIIRGQLQGAFRVNALLFILALHGGLPGVAAAHEAESHGRGKPPVERREIYHRPPRLDLVTQEGTSFSLDHVRRKVVLVTFAYTSCPDVCPLLTAKLAAIQRKLKKKNLGGSVHLLMITVDPEIDTPPVLKEYARKYGADLASWSFLTGPRSALEQTWNDFGVVAVRRAKGDIDHTAMTVLLDPQGRQRLQYLGFGWLEADVIRDIEGLVQEVSRSQETPPAAVALKYAQAIYARDFPTAYLLLSAQDRRLKGGEDYARERGTFTGFTLGVAKRLAGFIEAATVEKEISGNRATVKLRLRLPDANADELANLLSNWEEERLNALPVKEQKALIQRLDQWQREGKIPFIEGEQAFELVKEVEGWKILLNWAAGVRVIFRALVPPALPLDATPVQEEVLTLPGELFYISFQVRNRSSREISTRIAHHVEPKAMADYLELVQCGLLFPVSLGSGSEETYSSTYLVRGDLPEGVRRFEVTYEFRMEEK